MDCKCLATIEFKAVGGVLKYKVAFADPPAEEAGKGPIGLWLLSFYDAINFLGSSGEIATRNKVGLYCNKYQEIKWTARQESQFPNSP